MSGEAEYECVLLIKAEVFVYKIPPRTTNRGYRANEWNLNSPDWTGRLRLVTKSGQVPGQVFIKLEDKTSGQLFAQCPIDSYPGVAVEAVSDSSRYFVFRIQDDNGRNAFIGVGFADRSDSFDLNVALQDHFKGIKKEQAIEKEKEEPQQALDLGFKEGQTIKINMRIANKRDKDGDSPARAKKAGTGSLGGILPPPPGGVKIGPPPASIGLPVSNPITPSQSPSHRPAQAAQLPPTNSANNTDWVQF